MVVNYKPLKKGEVFVLNLLEKILSIKIKDKQVGVEGLLFQTKDSKEKLNKLGNTKF